MRIANEASELFGQGQLEALLQHEDEVCISIYLPCARMGAETKVTPFRLNQLLDRVEAQLVAKGFRLPDAQAMLKPARDFPIGARAPFWQRQQEGLAIFIGRDCFHFFQLPLAFAEQVSIGTRFAIRPLLPLLSGNGVFYVLALSEKQVRFLRGTRYSVEEIPLRVAPHSLAETLKFDEFEKQIQQHSTASGGLGRGSAAVFHGQGDAGDAALNRKHILRYVSEIDAEVSMILAGSHAPLVLAGVESMQGLYRTASHYTPITKSGINGNPDHLSAKHLHERAWPLVAEQFQQPKADAIEKFCALHSAGKQPSHTTWRSLLQEAYTKRVDTLFIPEDAHISGTFDEETDTISIHPQPEAGDQDLVDTMAAYTLRNGGMVYVLGQSEMPMGLPVAAILRA